MNIHKSHKVIPIIDLETLKKENVSINEYTKDFDINFENISNIKSKIEHEINEINIRYEKVNEEINKSFKVKHEKLINEENNMKNKLDNEVTKIKVKLEEHLLHVNELIKNYELINRGIKTLNKDENNNHFNIIRNLTYVSKINKNMKEINKIIQILMNNIKINFIEDEVKYEEYYFNGLSTPKDIQINNMKSNQIEISWKIDDLNFINIDKNQIKYKVEIRKENDKFKSVYVGKKLNCTIERLNSDTNYEIKIYTLYNNINNNICSEIKKVKTNKINIDSIILNESKRCDEFMNIIYEWTEGKNIELLYRGTRDGMAASIFHNKCDNKGPTIILAKNDKGNIFGGYASMDWKGSNGNYHSAPDSFLFTLTNIYNTSPIKFPNSDINNSIYDEGCYGPIFGKGYDIFFGFSSYQHISYFPKSYEDILGKGYSIFTGDTNSNYINLREFEVFKLIK